MSSSDKYFVTKNGDDDVVTIHELCSVGRLVFMTPLTVTISLYPEENVGYATYDFGMEYRISINKQHNFLYNYTGDNTEADPAKTIISTIKYDLMHAFFHYENDLNYEIVHWALVGWLQNRVIKSELM